jgi:hypothetical protein
MVPSYLRTASNPRVSPSGMAPNFLFVYVIIPVFLIIYTAELMDLCIKAYLSAIFPTLYLWVFGMSVKIKKAS